jgi:hypothetical protein
MPIAEIGSGRRPGPRSRRTGPSWAYQEVVMTQIDVNPMIVALRTNPNDFEMKRGWLHHFPSHHAFKFDAKGNVRIHAACDCAMLSVRTEQSVSSGKPTSSGICSIGGLVKSTGNSPLISVNPIRFGVCSAACWQDCAIRFCGASRQKRQPSG